LSTLNGITYLGDALQGQLKSGKFGWGNFGKSLIGLGPEAATLSEATGVSKTKLGGAAQLAGPISTGVVHLTGNDYGSHVQDALDRLKKSGHIGDAPHQVTEAEFLDWAHRMSIDEQSSTLMNSVQELGNWIGPAASPLGGAIGTAITPWINANGGEKMAGLLEQATKDTAMARQSYQRLVSNPEDMMKAKTLGLKIKPPRTPADYFGTKEETGMGWFSRLMHPNREQERKQKNPNDEVTQTL
jgi:hypothetical protein